MNPEKPGNYRTRSHVVVAIQVTPKNLVTVANFIWDHNGASIVVPTKGVIAFTRHLDGVQIPIGDWLVWDHSELATYTDRQFQLAYQDGA